MRTTALPFELDHDEIQTHDIPARAIRGTARIDTEDLVVEFSLVGSTAGDGPRTARIPIAGLHRVTMTGGTVKSPRLLLDAANDQVLNELPWADGRQCVMRFRRAHGQRLRELIEEIEVRMAEIRTRER